MLNHVTDTLKRILISILPSHPLSHRLVPVAPPPRAEHHEGVVDPDAQQEERRRHVQRHELHAEVAEGAERGRGGQRGRGQPGQADQRLGPGPVGLAGGRHGEADHDEDVEDEDVGDGQAGLLHLPARGVGYEPADL